MNTNLDYRETILTDMTSAGLSAATVAADLYAAEVAVSDYATRCARTVIITASIDANVTNRTDVARGIALSRYPQEGPGSDAAMAEHGDPKKGTKNYEKAMQAGRQAVTRYYRAGAILIAHPSLDAEDVVSYANQHDNSECSLVERMTTEEAQEEIAPKAKGPKGSQKSEAEKDLAAVEALLKRIRKAGEAGDRQRVEALDAALTMLTEALPDAYAASEEGAEAEAV